MPYIRKMNRIAPATAARDYTDAMCRSPRTRVRTAYRTSSANNKIRFNDPPHTCINTSFHALANAHVSTDVVSFRVYIRAHTDTRMAAHVYVYVCKRVCRHAMVRGEHGTAGGKEGSRDRPPLPPSTRLPLPSPMTDPAPLCPYPPIPRGRPLLLRPPTPTPTTRTGKSSSVIYPRRS